ncbi:MAG: low affinity iron permease family protein [Chloroflexota bacterium]
MPKSVLVGFQDFARWAARAAGYPWTFLLALGVVVVWAVTGPAFGFSDTWQLVINTGTTIVTFLMVFLIQNTQNRDSEAVQIKLDELIRALRGARNDMINIESLTEEELDALRLRYEQLSQRAKDHAEKAHKVSEVAELGAATAGKLSQAAEKEEEEGKDGRDAA